MELTNLSSRLVLSTEREFYQIFPVMEVLIVQSASEGKNRIPDFEDSAVGSRFRRVYSIDEAISAIKFMAPSVVILDVDIENGQGFRVFEDTSDVTYEKIILSSENGRRLKSIRFDVALHLRKPLQPQELHLALLSSIFKRQAHGIQQLFKEKFDAFNQVRLTQVFLKTVSGMALLPVSSMICIENLGQKRLVSLTDGKRIETTTSMQRIQKLLRGNGFVLTHGSVLLQAEHILNFGKFEGASVAVLRSGKRFSISYRDECKIRFLWQQTHNGIS
jgi:DNA-binding LytR/AlgR family response regulator